MVRARIQWLNTHRQFGNWDEIAAEAWERMTYGGVNGVDSEDYWIWQINKGAIRRRAAIHADIADGRIPHWGDY